MAESSVRIGIYASDKASGTIKSVQGTLQGIAKDAKSSILTGIGLGAGVTAFNLLSNAVGGTVQMMGEFVQSAIDDETSTRRLTAALTANIPGWDGNTAAIEETIEASQRLGFTDDQTRESLAFLTAATHDVTRAQELHAAAMDLARFKGIDLRSASEALVKVEGGRFRLLASLGIQLREGASATEALAAVQAVAAGQAEAWGDSTAGALQAVQIELEEAGEDIGRELLPLVLKLAVIVRDDLIPALNEAVSWVKENTEVIGGLFEGIANLFGGQLTGALFDVKDALIESFGAIKTWVGGLEEAVPKVEAAGDDMHDGIIDPLEEARHEARLVASIIPSEVAKAMIDGQKDVEAGMELLKELMTDEWDDAARTAYFKGILTSQELAAGLASADADVRSQAIFVRDNALRELSRLESGAYDEGADAGQGLGRGITSARPAVTAAAGTVRGDALRGLYLDATQTGKNVGNTYANGLTSSKATVIAAAKALSLPVMKVLAMAGSPDYTHSREIGERVGETWGEGLRNALVRLPDMAGLLPGTSRFGGAYGGPMGEMAGAPSGTPPALHIYLDGRELTQSTARWDYYAAPGGPSRLPR